MNGLEKIVARMEADTQAACDALAASAAENAAAILRDCQAQADAVTRDSAQRAEAQAAEHLEHLNGSSQLACRQRVLAAKQQLIDEAFARAAQALAVLPRRITSTRWPRWPPKTAAATRSCCCPRLTGTPWARRWWTPPTPKGPAPPSACPTRHGTPGAVWCCGGTAWS